MAWNLTFFVLHVIGALGAAILLRGAPCWMQRLVMRAFIVAMTLGAVAFGFAIAGYEYVRWPVLIIAFSIEHLAVWLWLFKTYYDNKVKWTSLASSPNLSR
jgi:hypothetical protein